MMNKEYYIVSVKHIGCSDNTFQFWGENGSGYPRCIEDAGLYSLQDAYEFELKQHKIFVHKDKITPLLQTIRLAMIGNKKETYAGRNEFKVLPNTGQVRKFLGITTLDFNLEGNRNSFDAYFPDTVIEKFKYVRSKTSFHVKAKEHVSEFWYLDEEFEADNRNQAINKAYKYWIPADYDTYLEFKKDVTCKRVKTQILDKWVTI